VRAKSTDLALKRRSPPSSGKSGLEQFNSIMMNPTLTPAQRQYLTEQMMEQNQPIQMPFRNGYVLIDPKDLCHQQFVPLQ
jgi:hypothetical protein